MRHGLVQLVCAVVLMVAGHAQQSHWATPNDDTAKYMIDMERKWAEGVCGNNGVVSEMLADDFQGTSTHGERRPRRGIGRTLPESGQERRTGFVAGDSSAIA